MKVDNLLKGVLKTVPKKFDFLTVIYFFSFPKNFTVVVAMEKKTLSATTLKKSRFCTKSGTKNSTKKSRFSNCNLLFFPTPKILGWWLHWKKTSLSNHIEKK